MEEQTKEQDSGKSLEEMAHEEYRVRQKIRKEIEIEIEEMKKDSVRIESFGEVPYRTHVYHNRKTHEYAVIYDHVIISCRQPLAIFKDKDKATDYAYANADFPD